MFLIRAKKLLHQKNVENEENYKKSHLSQGCAIKPMFI